MTTTYKHGALMQIPLRDKGLIGQCRHLVGHVDTQLALIQCYSKYQQHEQAVEAAMRKEFEQMMTVVEDFSAALADVPEHPRSSPEQIIDCIVTSGTSAIYAEIFAATDQALELLNRALMLDHVHAEQYARLRASLQSAPDLIARSIDEGLEMLEQRESGDELSPLNRVRVVVN